MEDRTSAGKISVDIVGNEKPLQKTVENLDNTLKVPLAKVGKRIAAAFSVAALIKFGKESVETAASVNAANSQMSQTFGELEGTARSAISSVAKEAGILETRLQGTGTSIYAFAKASGMDSTTALNMMKDALEVTADSAAYYDRSIEETAESLKSFLKGNFANDAALGISCTETTRNIAANKLYGKSFKDLSEAQKQLTLLQMVKDANKLSGAVGQAKRESEGWENVTGNLKEQWRQLLGVIGQPILKVATLAIKKLTFGLQVLTNCTRYAISALSKLFNWDLSGLTSGADEAASGMGAVADTADDSTDSINSTTKAAEKLKKAVAGFDQLNILSSDKNSSDDDSDTGITAASSFLPDVSANNADTVIGKKIDTLKEKLKDLYDLSGLKRFVDGFKSQFNKIDFKAIGNNFKSIFTDLQPIAKAAFGGLQQITQSSFGLIGTIIGGRMRAVGNIIQTVSGGIAQWLSKDKEKIIGYITDISSNISLGLDGLSSFFGTVFDAFNESLEEMREDTQNAISDLLSGFTTFAGSVGLIISDMFRIASQKAAEWAEDNKEELKKFFSGIQEILNKLMSLIGKILSDIGNELSSWWNDRGGKEVFEEICSFIGDVATLLLNIFNNIIKPVICKVIDLIGRLWDKFKPVLGKILDLLRAVSNFISMVWNKYLKPVVGFIVKYVGPVIVKVIDKIASVIEPLWEIICSVIGGIIDVLTGIIDFLTGIFSGDWEKAWGGISKIFTGIWDSIKGVIKGLWDGIVNIFKGAWDKVESVWSGAGDFFSGIWDGIQNTFSGVAEFFGNVFKGAWDGIKKVWEGAGKFFSGIWDGIKNAFSSVKDVLCNIFKGAWDGIKNAWSGVGNFFSGVWGNIKNAFSGAKDWISNQFKAAWDNVVKLFKSGGEIFKGIGESFGNIFKKVINGMIGGLNWVIAKPFEGLNAVLKGIKSINIMGAKPFDWIKTIPVPQIPKLAKGGLVTAPTLAMVGDNKGASHDPEVVSPLSKLQEMIKGSDPEIIRLLLKIVGLLENQEDVFQNNIYLDSEKIESRLVRVRKRKQRRWGGASV